MADETTDTAAQADETLAADPTPETQPATEQPATIEHDPNAPTLADVQAAAQAELDQADALIAALTAEVESWTAAHAALADHLASVSDQLVDATAEHAAVLSALAEPAAFVPPAFTADEDLTDAEVAVLRELALNRTGALSGALSESELATFRALVARL